jgi:hypothetical protein
VLVIVGSGADNLHCDIPFWHIVCHRIGDVPTRFREITELDATNLTVAV